MIRRILNNPWLTFIAVLVSCVVILVLSVVVWAIWVKLGTKATIWVVVLVPIFIFLTLVAAAAMRAKLRRRQEQGQGKIEAKPKPGTLTWLGLLQFIMIITTLFVVSWKIVSLQDALSEERARSKRNLEVAEQTAYWLHWELGPGEYDPESGMNQATLKVQMILSNDEELRFIAERQVNGEIRHTLYSLKRDYSKPRSYAGTWTQTEPGGKSGTVFLNQDGAKHWQGMIRNTNGFGLPCQVYTGMKKTS